MLKHIAKLLASDVIAKGANFLLGIYLVRNMPQENYGAYQYVLAILGYFTAIGSFGLDNYALKQVAQSPAPAKFAGEIITVKLLLSAAAAMIYFPAALLMLDHPTVFMVAYINVVLTIASLDWLLYFHQQSSLLSAGKLAAVMAKAAVIYFGLGITDSVHIPLAADALFAGVPLSIYLFLGFKHGRIKLNIPQFSAIKYHLLEARFFFYFLLVNTLIASTDFILLKHMIGYEAVAQYGIAYMYIPLANNALAIVVNLYVPKISRAGADFRSLIKSYFGYILAFQIALWIFAAILGQYFFTAIYTEKYSNVVTTFYWMMIVASLQSIQIYLISVLNARNMMRINFKICSIGAITNIAANLILIPLYGVNGAAMAMLAANLVMIAAAAAPFYRVVHNA